AGEVTENLVVFGGNVSIADTAKINLDLVAVGGNYTKSPGAAVGGQVITEFPESSIPTFRRGQSFQPITNATYGLTSVVSYFLNTLIFTALAVLIVLFLPKQVENTADTIVSQPLTAGGLGCLTIPVVVITSIVIMFFIITIPLSILAMFALAIALVFGWIAAGYVIGRRLADALDQDWSNIVQAGVGMFTLSIVTGGLGFAQPLGGLVSIAIGSVGLGAVLISRFGTQAPQESSPQPLQIAQEAEAVTAPASKPAKPKSVAKTKTKTASKTKTKTKATKKKTDEK
ncbi:MAG: hypothetical protein N2C13_04450, partial [Chloroflexota bacterium]